MNPFKDGVLEDYRFALNLGFSESFVFCRGFFLYGKSIIFEVNSFSEGCAWRSELSKIRNY